MYNSIEELVRLSQEREVPLHRIVLDNEMLVTDCSEEAVLQRLDARYEVMERSALRALDQGLPTAGGLIEGIASTQNRHASSENTVGGAFFNRLMARALSCSEVNAAMGKICAAPTAGACGILPAVLLTVGERYRLDRPKVLEGLLVATGIGAIITRNATVSGAEGGCQAECGTAAAMAAAATVHMAGGAGPVVAHAVSIALMNCMGLVCDPVAGLVQVPCAQRNASQAVNAVISADMALGGMESVIPADEVVEAMYKTGRMLPMQLKETALGGIAATATGKAIQKRIFK